MEKETLYAIEMTSAQVRQVRIALQQAVFYKLVPYPEEIEPIINKMNTAV